MIKRVIEVSHAGTYLSVKLGQLIVKQEGEEKARIPCEDVGVYTTLCQRGKYGCSLQTRYQFSAPGR